jgi:integrase
MRSRGDGRIFARKGTKLLWCQYSLRGKQFRESTGESDALKAEKYLKRRLKEVGADQIGAKQFVGPQQERITVAELLDALEADYKLRGKDSPQFKCHLKHIRAYFGNWRAMEVTAESVDRFISEQLKAMAPATINRSTQLLHQSFKLATDRRRLATSPLIRHLSEAGNARQGFFTEAEFNAVVTHLPDYLKDYCRFAYLTGWRKSEVASLRWEDLDGEVIRLRSENSKNREGRTVPVVGELAELIERRRAARQVKTDAGGTIAALVFHNAGHAIVDLRKAWATACKFANVPGRLFHDLRRCAVRNMVRAGVPTDIARSISGHKTASIFSRYNIVAEDQKREAMERTQVFLREAAESAQQTAPKVVNIQ